MSAGDVPGQLHVAIIGAGATGVELAAELRNTTRDLVSYGLDGIDPDEDIKLDLIEASARILPALPERLSAAAAALLRDLDGLETNGLNQLAVGPTLQTTRDENVFVIGDCAACPWMGKEGNVPPRAQAAHQQAAHMSSQIQRRLAAKSLLPYRYRDFGALVSLGRHSTVGSLMGGLVGGSLMLEGYFAGLMYASPRKMHDLALYGLTKVAMDTLARLITRRTEPHVKLH